MDLISNGDTLEAFAIVTTEGNSVKEVSEGNFAAMAVCAATAVRLEVCSTTEVAAEISK